MKRIHIQYHAILREQRGLAEETFETNAATAEELYVTLQNQYGFPLNPDRLRVAINDEMTDWKAKIKSNDQVVFIPPVAGG